MRQGRKTSPNEMKTIIAFFTPPLALVPCAIRFEPGDTPAPGTFSFISSAPPKPVMDQLEGALRRTDAAMARGGNHALNHGGGNPGLPSLQAPPAAKIIGPARCPAGSAPTAVVHLARHGAQREAATGSVRSLPSSAPPDGLPHRNSGATPASNPSQGRAQFP